MVAKRNGTHETAWRKRQIVLPDTLVERLFDWHGGQSSMVYALASTGMRHLVSLSMIDGAIDELIGVKARSRGKGMRGLKPVIDGLGEVRQFWKEHSAKEAGMDTGRAEYDARDYGFTAAEEAEFPAKSG